MGPIRIGRLRWMGSPALHFLILGTLLYLGETWMGTGADALQSPRLLTVGPARIEQLRSQWQAQAERPPSAVEEDWLIRQWIEDELLFRQALELGLHRDDPGVCYRLALNMNFLGLDGGNAAEEKPGRQALCQEALQMGLHLGDPVIRRQMVGLIRIMLQRTENPQEIPQQELQDYLERRPERFTEPARIRLSHVFLSRDQRGSALEKDARRLLQRLRDESADPQQATKMGDAFLAGHHPPSSSLHDLERNLGADFARAAMELPEGRWSGPVRSGYGLHLVWVYEKRPGRLKLLQEVQDQAVLGLEAERAEKRLKRAIQRLHERWEVRVERE